MPSLCMRYSYFRHEDSREDVRGSHPAVHVCGCVVGCCRNKAEHVFGSPYGGHIRELALLHSNLKVTRK